MTTIAVSETEMAADGLVLWGSEITRTDDKKIRNVGGTLYALAGVDCLFDALVQWHRDGAEPKEAPQATDNSNWNLIVVNGSGVYKYHNTAPYPEQMPIPVAFGAAGDYATGAMLAGMTATRAIEIACSISNTTGGKIQTVKLRDVFGGNLTPTRAIFSHEVARAAAE